MDWSSTTPWQYMWDQTWPGVMFFLMLYLFVYYTGAFKSWEWTLTGEDPQSKE